MKKEGRMERRKEGKQVGNMKGKERWYEEGKKEDERMKGGWKKKEK